MSGPPDAPITMAIVGCGRLGTAILRGLLATFKDTGDSCARANGDKDGEFSLPARFLACVRTAESASALGSLLAQHSDPASGPTVEILRGQNVEAVRQASSVLLACQPTQLPGILAEEGMAEALRGKLAISICVGLSEMDIKTLLYGTLSSDAAVKVEPRCYIVHAMPNPASMVAQSATVLAERDEPLPPQYDYLVSWVFSSIGTVTTVAPALMNAASITAGSTAGFLGPVLIGITAGAVEAGIDKQAALLMAAQAMKGTAELVLRLGEKPEEIMDKTATPGGCTERGLLTLMSSEHKGSVPAAFEEAMRVAIRRAFEVGEAPKN